MKLMRIVAAVLAAFLMTSITETASAADMPTSAAPGMASIAAEVACARPSASTFVAEMNEAADLSMRAFLDRKASRTPCYFDWSDDGCSMSPDSGSYYNFLKSCKRHDFGYRNSKRAESWYGVNMWSYHNKAVTDTTFRKDMTDHCFSREESQTNSCLTRRTQYYNIVAGYGPFPTTQGDYRHTYGY